MEFKLLFIFPTGGIVRPSSGNQVRVSNLIRRLSERGHKVTIIQQETMTNQLPSLKNIEIREFKSIGPLSLVDFNPLFLMQLSEFLIEEDVDFIQVEGFAGVLGAKSLVKLLNKDTNVLYDAHNVESEKIREDGAPDLSIYMEFLGRYLIPLLEKMATSLADHIFTVSDNDAAVFRDKLDISERKTTTIPSGTTLAVNNDENGDVDMTINKDNKRKLVFHGDLNYFPNREAVQLLIERVVPRIKEKHDNVEFIIVGKGGEKYFDSGINGVRFTGYVDDLNNVLSSADIAIVPLISGGGTKLKMFDYMNNKLPIITTEVGSEGISLEHNVHALITAQVDAVFIDFISELLEEPARRRELGRNAHELVKDKYNWESIADSLEERYSLMVE